MPEQSTREAREFRIDEERPQAGAVVLSLRGDADLHIADELRERLFAALRAGAPLLVVDLSEVTFLDSSALGALVAASKRGRVTGGELRLVVPRADMRRIFEVTLLDRVLSLVTTREDALSSPSAGG